jgi:hypothetical protein
VGQASSRAPAHQWGRRDGGAEGQRDGERDGETEGQREQHKRRRKLFRSVAPSLFLSVSLQWEGHRSFACLTLRVGYHRRFCQGARHARDSDRLSTLQSRRARRQFDGGPASHVPAMRGRGARCATSPGKRSAPAIAVGRPRRGWSAAGRRPSIPSSASADRRSAAHCRCHSAARGPTAASFDRRFCSRRSDSFTSPASRDASGRGQRFSASRRGAADRSAHGGSIVCADGAARWRTRDDGWRTT